MARCLRLQLVVGSLLFAFSLVFGQPASAQNIWSGLTKTFTKSAGSNPTLPENQDALTSNVILTRGSSGGLFNIAAESFYTPTVSPTNTLWATDLNNSGKTIAATNWQDLTFTNWIDAYGGSHTGGTFIAGRDAVVCLISGVECLASADAILDLKFTSWTAGTGFGFTYMRAEPPPTGDYNGDGTVNAADYVVWRKTFLLPVSPGSGADGNKSGSIDAGDYTYWRERFGNPAASGSGLQSFLVVPEPASLALLLVGSLLLFRTRAR